MPGGYVYVDGTVGDIEHGVLRDRKKLAEEGVVMAVVTVDRQQSKLSCPPVIETRGWVYAPEAEELLEEASEVVAAAVTQALRDGAHDIEVLSRHTRKALGKFVGDRTQAAPDDRARRPHGLTRPFSRRPYRPRRPRPPPAPPSTIAPSGRRPSS